MPCPTLYRRDANLPHTVLSSVNCEHDSGMSQNRMLAPPASKDLLGFSDLEPLWLRSDPGDPAHAVEMEMVA